MLLHFSDGDNDLFFKELAGEMQWPNGEPL